MEAASRIRRKVEKQDLRPWAVTHVRKSSNGELTFRAGSPRSDGSKPNAQLSSYAWTLIGVLPLIMACRSELFACWPYTAQ